LPGLDSCNAGYGFEKAFEVSTIDHNPPANFSTWQFAFSDQLLDGAVTDSEFVRSLTHREFSDCSIIVCHQNLSLSLNVD
jgi:hypothetical protein